MHLPARDYPIIIGKNLLNDSEILNRYVTSGQVLIVTNQTIAPLYLHFLIEAFSDKQCDVVVLEDGEPYKNQESLFQIYNALIEKRHHRDTTLIALGGGVVGDITGFAASTYQRGVSFLQIPSTLLAQVDSSVGGKTAINHPLGKNMVGSFYQPAAVLIDINTLQTLPIREISAGFAEIIKYGILVGGEFLTLIKGILPSDTPLNFHPGLIDVITQCCQIKANIVQQDERETGIRALLNLGHTVAHALEAYTCYNRWLHGEAVGIGLYCAALLSQHTTGLNEDVVKEIDDLLALANLPRRIPRDIDLDLLCTLMKKDKKVKNDTMRFILIKATGSCYIEDKITDANLRTVLQWAVEGE